MGAMIVEKQYSDGYWQSSDGLRLHYRDYAGNADRPPIICISGLTRNARDFEALAEQLSPRHRIICIDLRGRGESEHAKDSASYTPPVYVADVERLITELGLRRVIMFGTSLGGLVTMALAAAAAWRLVAVMLNDVGPVVEEEGLARIRSYVGRNSSWPTWVHAARALAELNAGIYPDYGLADWLRLAKQAFRVTSGGRIVPDYDRKISENVLTQTPAVDLWPLYDALALIPTLIVRGALSDILSDATAQAMVARSNNATLVTIPRVGHAPMLSEPDAVTAIEAFLSRTAP
jgi:pimeloyl-ACP methyl ester carboxylesterase